MPSYKEGVAALLRLEGAFQTLIGDLRPSDEDETKAGRDTERADEDLEAQQGMAFWAILMTGATIAQAALSAFGVWLIWETLKATRRAVDEAKQATQAATASIDVTREIGEAQVRCYLHIASASICIRSDGYPVVAIKVANSGQSPAMNFVWRPAVNYGRVEVLGENAVLCERNCAAVEPSLEAWGNDIASDEVFSAKTQFGFAANQEEMHAISTINGLIFGVDIIMAWRDVFGKEFRLIKGFKGHAKEANLDETFTLGQLGDMASLTQHELRQRHEERERAKEQANAARVHARPLGASAP